MNTPIADMIEAMLEQSIPMKAIILAVRTAEQMANPSTRHQVDETTERRRAWDREYRRKQRDAERVSTRHPPDIHPTSADNALLLREDKKLSEEVIRKERKKERGSKLSADWKPTEAHYAEGLLRGMDRAAVDRKGADMRSWAEANSNRSITTKSNWDQAFFGWLRREPLVGDTAKPLTAFQQSREKTIDIGTKLQDAANRLRGGEPVVGLLSNDQREQPGNLRSGASAIVLPLPRTSDRGGN